MSRIITLGSSSEPHRFRRNLRFIALKRKARATEGLSAQDVRHFLMAYTACFLAVSTFIA